MADLPKRIVLCLDGTWNGTYVRKRRSDYRHVVKPSNVLKLARAVLPQDPDTGRAQIVYYDTGVGSLAEYPGAANWLLRRSDRLLGGARGAGFEVNVEDALSFLAFNHVPGDEVFIYGFSRGAATARAITHFVDWAGGLPTKRDAYYLPALFRAYVASRASTSSATWIEQINLRRLSERPPRAPLGALQPIDVVLLAVWDTVIAMGSRSAIPGKPGNRNFHVREQPARCVRDAMQALAIDERRYDFRPEIWQSAHAGQTLSQRWFAGVHSNVGGGYVDDGLANIALHWVAERTMEHGLALDRPFLDIYGGYALDPLYRSDTPPYRLMDAVRLRRGRGERALTGQPAAASLTLDPSVIDRMHSEADLPRPYRPRNVLRYLAEHPDFEDDRRSLDLPGGVSAGWR